MTTDADRIRELEDENARLRARMIAHGLLPPPCALPDADEFDGLVEIAETAWPRFQWKDERSRAEFSRALHAVAFMRRQRALNSTYAVSYWLDAANSWLSRYQMPRTTLQALTAAVVVSGIPHSPLHRWPLDIEFGLQIGGVSGPSSGWREVLRAGEAPAPVALERRLLSQSGTEHVRVERF